MALFEHAQRPNINLDLECWSRLPSERCIQSRNLVLIKLDTLRKKLTSNTRFGLVWFHPKRFIAHLPFR